MKKVALVVILGVLAIPSVSFSIAYVSPRFVKQCLDEDCASYLYKSWGFYQTAYSCKITTVPCVRWETEFQCDYEVFQVDMGWDSNSQLSSFDLLYWDIDAQPPAFRNPFFNTMCDEESEHYLTNYYYVGKEDADVSGWYYGSDGPYYRMSYTSSGQQRAVELWIVCV